MRELGITIWVVTLALAVFAAPKDKKSDLLKLRNGKSLEVIVLDLGNDSVHYRLPSLQKKYTIARDEVARVEYGDGTIVSLDKKGGVSGATSVAWRELPITRDPKDVEGLISMLPSQQEAICSVPNLPIWKRRHSFNYSNRRLKRAQRLSL